MVTLKDIEMKDKSLSLDLTYVDTSSRDGIRSPRTPTYIPDSPSLSNIAPFEPPEVFSTIRHLLSLERTPPQPNALPPPPGDPLAWVWICHLCHSRWHLGATRRCLVDGHFYCSGQADQKNLKKKKRGQSCSSEFDYAGWGEWGMWKRKALKTIANPQMPRGCERCEFPSQCRYSPSEEFITDKRSGSLPREDVECTRIASCEDDDLLRYYSNENVSFEPILTKVELAAKRLMQSKITDFCKSDWKRVKSESNKSATCDNLTKILERGPSKKSPLSPIEEELLRGEIVLGMQDLDMPIFEF